MPSSSGKPKKRKIKIIQKAKERTQEEIERDENWKASLVDTLHKLKPSFSDLENQLPEPIPLGTVGEYLSDDVNNGYAGIWYGVKIVRMKEGLHHDTGKPKREYLVQYLGDWEEEDVQGETLQDWVDSHLVRPNPPTSVGTVISEYVRGDQVDVIVDPKNAENEWYSGTVLRNIGDEGYDVTEEEVVLRFTTSCVQLHPAAANVVGNEREKLTEEISQYVGVQRNSASADGP